MSEGENEPLQKFKCGEYFDKYMHQYPELRKMVVKMRLSREEVKNKMYDLYVLHEQILEKFLPNNKYYFVLRMSIDIFNAAEQKEKQRRRAQRDSPSTSSSSPFLSRGKVVFISKGY